MQSINKSALSQTGITLWFTGLSGAGKTTTAINLQSHLNKLGLINRILDGDCIRHGLNSDLGFNAHDRTENIRRVCEVAKLFNEIGIITIVSFISPYHHDRQMARTSHDNANLRFAEVFVNAPLGVCETRDPKGLYAKARSGEIQRFTGINDPYEPPVSAELTIETDSLSKNQCVTNIIDYLKHHRIIV